MNVNQFMGADVNGPQAARRLSVGVSTEEKGVNPRTSISSVDQDAPNYEKALAGFVGTNEVIDADGAEIEDSYAKDPFSPFSDIPKDQGNILTIRAMFVGICCGACVNASNVYLGLKSGWTFSANIFGAIVGFAVLKFLSKYAKHIPLIGGDFGPQENSIVQTAACAAGGMSSIFISALPALYQLDLLNTPKEDFWRIVALTAVGGYFGFFFATPLRKFFIIYVARELRLIFPTNSATALTIRSMHLAAGGEALAKLKMRAMSGAFVGAMLLRVVSQYAIGILWDWHIFTWFYIWGHYNNSALAVENWGWFIEWTPAFIGSGILVGLNVATSFFGGSVLAWGIIGPALVHNGAAFGKAYDLDDPQWTPLVSFFSLSGKFASKDTPSPRYWLLWPGVLCMIAVAFTELACQWKVFYFAGKAIVRASKTMYADISEKRGKPQPGLRAEAAEEDSHMVQDSALPKDQVKMWMWLPGLVIVAILACVVMARLYGMPVGESLLALFLAFFFSILAVQCTGATDITPLTAASKASQIVLGGVTRAQHWSINDARRLNLLGGTLASVGANQAADLTGDFRTGFLLGTPPRIQWYAQAIGTVCAVFFAPAMFVLFVTAYPCIIDLDAETCPFGVPSVSAWRAVTVAMTDSTFPVPRSSGIFAIVFACLGSAMILIRHFVLTGNRAWMRMYYPNMMVVALAFVLPYTQYGTAMLIGATVQHFWQKKNAKSFEVYGYAVAAGLVAGEGIGGVINAIFQVASISGDVYGTQIACPGNSC